MYQPISGVLTYETVIFRISVFLTFILRENNGFLKGCLPWQCCNKSVVFLHILQEFIKPVGGSCSYQKIPERGIFTKKKVENVVSYKTTVKSLWNVAGSHA